MHADRPPRHRRYQTLLTIGALVSTSVTPFVLVAPTATAASATASPQTQVTRTLQLGGMSTYRATAAGADLFARGTEIRQQGGPGAFGAAVAGQVATGRGAAPRSTPDHRSEARSGQVSVTTGGAAASAAVQPSDIVRTGPQLLQSFLGLDHRDQRLANNGNQFSVEPPDQGLCVGNGHIVEPVNDVIRVYSTATGAPQTGVEDLNTFLGYPPVVVRSVPRYGPFVTDPSCLFDPTTGQFFFTALTLGVNPSTGALSGQNQLDIAVAADPTGSWARYHLDVTDDGTNGTPIHRHCPCIGDYPHVGVDSNGFYITTNEYSFFGPEYNAAQIYAFSKTALARHDSTVFVTQFDTTGADKGNPGFTVWPAQSPVTSQFAGSKHGTEYFLSSTAAPEANGNGRSNSIVLWALTNTASLGTADPAATLTEASLRVQSYSIPPPANQQPGPAPLLQCLIDPACATFLNGEADPFPEALSPLDSNDTRMQQVTYAGGLLYGALDTGVRVGGATKAGVAYFVVKPEITNGRVKGELRNQGTIGVGGNNLAYPAIGITASGKGIMSFTLVGADYHPSAAFTAFDAKRGAGLIQLAAAGVGPQDGFSGYNYYNGGKARPRWGDYGATAVSGDTIWAAAEYIAQSCTLTQYLTAPVGSCGGTRTALANWATRISQIRP